METNETPLDPPLISSIESGLELMLLAVTSTIHFSVLFLHMFILPLVQCATRGQIITVVKNVLVLVVAGALMVLIV